MKKIILAFLCIFLSLFLFSKVKTYKAKYINSLIEQTIEIAPYDYKGKIYFSQNIKKQPKGGALEDFVKYNSHYIRYLLKSYVDNKEFKALKPLMKNKKKLNKKFIEIIFRNKKFTNSYRYLISSYLVSKGAKVKEFKNLKREVSILRALNTLSKFFYIHVYKKETGYRGHICIGFNGIEETSLKRDISLEAFCFNTVFSNIKTSIAFSLRPHTSTEPFFSKAATYLPMGHIFKSKIFPGGSFSIPEISFLVIEKLFTSFPVANSNIKTEPSLSPTANILPCGPKAKAVT